MYQNSSEESLKSSPSWIIGKFEKYFFWHGQKIAKRPYTVIISCLFLTGCCMVGLMNYKTESNPYKLWIPKDSKFIKNAEWLWTNHPPKIREHSVIVTASNVLRHDVLQFILKIHQNLANLTSSDGKKWSQKCLNFPIFPPNNELVKAFDDIDPENLPIFQDYEYLYSYNDNNNVKVTNIPRQKRSPEVDISIDLYPEEYCKIVDELGKSTCSESSIIELWANRDGVYNQETEIKIQSLTQEQILDDINNKNYSELFLEEKDFTAMLGGIKRNSNGKIESASATEIKFHGMVDQDNIGNNENELFTKRIFAEGPPADVSTLEFENALIEMLHRMTKKLPSEDIKMYFKTERSFNDEASQAVESDIIRFIIGLIVVYLFVLIMIGGFGWVQQRPFLGAIGLFNVLLAFLSSYGICSSMGLVFTPAHPLIPFLMLGIGIDDMFVIVQCLSNVEDSDISKYSDKKTELLVGETLKHAGVAITVTSLTDVIVLIVGTITELPGLQSFCVYSAIGIFLVFLLQTTLFIACLSLDIQRIKSYRNGCIPCCKVKKTVAMDLEKSKYSILWQKNPGKVLFCKYGEILMHPVSKTLVVGLTIVLGGIGIFGMTEIKQEFDIAKYLPPKSYVGDWIQAKKIYFPGFGDRAIINFGEIDYVDELWKLSSLTEILEKQNDIISSTDSWLREFKKYVKDNDILDIEDLNTIGFNKTNFYYRLTQFLFSPGGLKYQRNFEFDSQLKCGAISPKIKLTQIEFTHRIFDTRKESIMAMTKTREIVDSYNFSSYTFPIAKDYLWNEIDQVISRELFQNIGISIICVFISSGLLLAHLKSFMLVFLCVVLSMVDLIGFLHFWNLTVDIISYGCILISIGLCIDYAAHIAHTFMITPGENGNTRAIKTLANIGSAVMNGGFSTFLAFVTTCTSQSHSFVTFFKTMTLIVIFGLYHGLILLPVLLSLLEFKIPWKRKMKVMPKV